MFVGIPQVVKGVTIHQMLDEKTCNDQVPDGGYIFCKKSPCLVLPGAVLVHEAFQQFRLLNQVGITLTVGVEFVIQKGRERIEGFEKLHSRLFHQRNKFFFGNDLG